jgi:hypothetical protein
MIFRVASAYFSLFGRAVFFLVLMCFANVSLLWRYMLSYFASFFWGISTLLTFTVGLVWLRRVNVICVDLLWFILILHFFAHSSILLIVAWSFIEAIAGSSCVAKSAVSSAKVTVVVLSDFEKEIFW